MTRNQAEQLIPLAIALTELRRFSEARRALTAVEIFTAWSSHPRAVFYQDHLLWKPLADMCLKYENDCFPFYSPKLLLNSDFWALRMPTLTIASRLPVETLQPLSPMPLKAFQFESVTLITVPHSSSLIPKVRLNGTR